MTGLSVTVCIQSSLSNGEQHEEAVSEGTGIGDEQPLPLQPWRNGKQQLRSGRSRPERRSEAQHAHERAPAAARERRESETGEATQNTCLAGRSTATEENSRTGSRQ